MKVLLCNKRYPAISLERTRSGDIKAVHLTTGIHATYHSTGHNHFFDPNNSRNWKKETKSHPGELVNCTTSLPFSAINKPEFFIGMNAQTSPWKEKYRKIRRIEMETDNIISVFLSSDLFSGYVSALEDSHPYVLVRF